MILKVQDLGDVVADQLGRTIAMDKNYKIVEIPEVRCHQKLLKVLLDSLTSKGQCKIKST